MSPAFESTTDSRGGEAKSVNTSSPINWSNVRRVLVVRLRSIGDTVLITPFVRALREFLPHASVDVLLEDWVAPLLDGHADVDRTIAVDCKSLTSRLRIGRDLRRAQYDVAFNLHAGTTAAMLTRASGARFRIGYDHSRLKNLHNIVAPPAHVLWGDRINHTAARHLALLEWTGVPVRSYVPSHLTVTQQAARSVEAKLCAAPGHDEARFGATSEIALLHPAAAFESKRWATSKFARAAEQFAARGFVSVAVGARNEKQVLAQLVEESSAPIVALSDLTLPEVTALAGRARIFLGNDSGIAHIAAAVGTPSVVIFGSSNPAQWAPWTSAPAEVVRAEDSETQNSAEADDAAQRIDRIGVERVIEAAVRVLEKSSRRETVGNKIRHEQLAAS